MNRIHVFYCLYMAVLLLFGWMPSPSMAMNCDVSAYGQADESIESISSQPKATPFSHYFDSGAQWNFCWHIDQHAGLTLTNVHYGPPAEPATKVLDSASLAQILFKYDQDVAAEHVITSTGLGESNHIAPEPSHCAEGSSVINENGQGICTKVRDLNTLTTVRRSKTLRRHELSLHAFSSVGTKTFEQVWRFSEDGQIEPAVRLSGNLDRFTNNAQYGSAIATDVPLASNAALLFTWRLDFNIGGTPANDVVEQFDFVSHITNVVRRSISKRKLSSESFNNVERTQFRGWLIRDTELSAGIGRTTRMGYYLDPQSSGFDFVSRHNNWAGFDFSVTRAEVCERFASNNSVVNVECGNSLDQFVNGESITGEDIVVWFSLARQLLPKAEDYPVITAREGSFKLIPFDWSASTPFTPLTE